MGVKKDNVKLKIFFPIMLDNDLLPGFDPSLLKKIN